MSKVKSDKRRCSPQKAAFWRRHVDAWRESGLSQAEYSRRHGVSVKALWYWKRRFEKEQNPSAAAPVIVAVQPSQLPPREKAYAPLMLYLQSGLRVEVCGDFDPAVLAKLVRTVERFS